MISANGEELTANKQKIGRHLAIPADFVELVVGIEPTTC